ncbi:MAG TPA: hypothetical protein VGF79_00705 [Bacteroidia bacterium]
MRFEAVKIRDFEGHTQAVYALAYDSISAEIFSGSADGMLVNWRLDQKDGDLILQNSASIYCICINSEFILTGNRDGTITILDLKTKNLIKRLKLSDAPIFSIVSFDDHWMIGDGNGKLMVLDGNFNLKLSLPLAEKSIRQIKLHEASFFVATSDPKVFQLDMDFNVISAFSNHESSVFTVETDKDGNVFTGGRDAAILVHKNNLLVKKTQAHLLHIHQLSLSPDARLLASCSMDKTIKIWETESMELMKVIDAERHGGHHSSVNKILWIDKNTIISCSDDRTLKCFEIKER